MSDDLLGPVLAKLQKAIEDDEIETILSLSEEGLTHSPDDPDLLRCKLTALTDLSKFEELVSFLSATPALRQQNGLPYSYSLFSLGRHSEAEEYLSDPSNRDPIFRTRPVGLLHLEAQIGFVLGNYGSAVTKYEELLRRGIRDLETYTNYAACLVLSEQSDRCVTEVEARLEDVNEDEEEDGEGEDPVPFQVFYNLSCAYTDLHKLERARSVLAQAQKVCRMSLLEGGEDEESILDSLTPCTVLEAYVSQMYGQIDVAEESFLGVIRRRPAGHTVPIAVASNNLVALHAKKRGTASVFEAERRMRAAGNESVRKKLTKWQRRALHLNRILLLLQLKRFEEANQMFEDLEKNYPGSDIPTLISASMAYRKKEFDRAISILKGDPIQESQSSETDDPSSPSPPQIVVTPTVEISLAQLYLNRGDINAAISVLQNCSLRHRPSVVGCLVGLFRKTGRTEDCLTVFEESVDYWKVKYAEISSEAEAATGTGPFRKAEVEKILVTLLRENAACKFQIGRHQDAISTYEDMRQIDAENLTYVAGLVIALADHDSALAVEHVAELPSISLGKWRPDRLEKLNINMVPSRRAAPDSPASPAPAQTRRKKKRKNPTPKHFDPSGQPDPERWIPKWERRANRSRARKKQKRWQGAVVDDGLDHHKGRRRRGKKKKDIGQIIRQSQKGQGGGRKRKGGRRRRH